MPTNYKRKIIIASTSISILFLVGVVGYMVVERENPEGSWTFVDALYMTAITLSTVGYDSNNMSDGGKLFSVALVMGGLSVFAYGISVGTAFIVEGQLHEIIRKRKMEKLVGKLSNHYIICGAGDTGIYSINEMIRLGADFVVVEGDLKRIEYLLETIDFLYVIGDATDDDVLHRAGIMNARGLITCLTSDRDNLFVVLSSKQMNPRLRAVAKAIEDRSPSKMRKAGADEVVQADQIGGLRLASAVMRPIVVDFLDMMLSHQTNTRFTQSIVKRGSSIEGKTLGEANIPKLTGLVVIGIQDTHGNFIYNPSRHLKLTVGSALITVANSEQLHKLNKLTGDTA